MNDTHPIDVDMSIGINKPDLITTKKIKNKIKNISNIVKEIKKLK